MVTRACIRAVNILHNPTSVDVRPLRASFICPCVLITTSTRLGSLDVESPIAGLMGEIGLVEMTRIKLSPCRGGVP